MPWTIPPSPTTACGSIFTCCHPALAPEAQVALTLRLVCGVATPDIAHAFLVAEPTMAARLTRAKKKIAAAAHPVRRARGRRAARTRSTPCSRSSTCCTPRATPRRRATSSCAATSPPGRWTWPACCARCCPASAEARGCWRCCWSTTPGARPAPTPRAGSCCWRTRTGRGWDRGRHRGGPTGSSSRPCEGGPPGRFALQAAIAALHAQAPSYAETDWGQILLLYDALRADLALARRRPQPRGRACGWSTAPRPAWPRSRRWRRPASSRATATCRRTKADLLRRLGRLDEAAAAYREALGLAENEAERAFLERRLAESGR